MVMSLHGGDVIRVVTHPSSCEAHIRGSPISAVERSQRFPAYRLVATHVHHQGEHAEEVKSWQAEKDPA